MQRLRFIRQLSLGFMAWPGATHSRFEHALGTMELAGQAFDAAIENTNRLDSGLLRAIEWNTPAFQVPARQLVRLGALLHDVGHSPFSHGPEDLFEGNLQHEDMTTAIIRESAITDVLRAEALGLDPEDVAAVATGPKYKGGARASSDRKAFSAGNWGRGRRSNGLSPA